jgi:hypothetical protein
MVTIKDIAWILRTDVKTVRRNEERWGLKAIRVSINPRVILYDEDKVKEALEKVGFALKSEVGTACSRSSA